MPSTTDKPPSCTHREQLPVRVCARCGCFLRTGQERATCDPCGPGEWELSEAEVLESLYRLPLLRRRSALSAMGELEELMSEPA